MYDGIRALAILSSYDSRRWPNLMPSKRFLRCHKKIARRAAITRTPTPIPTPRPIFSSVWAGEEVGVTVDAGLDVELDIGLDAVLGAKVEVNVGVTVETSVFGLSVVKLEIPTVAARAMRSFLAQHSSEAMFAPQHQLPSVEHCDMAIVPLACPPLCSR